MKPVLKAHLAVLCTNIFFAFNYGMVKLISPDHVGPYGLNILRAGLSAILFWVIWLFGKTDAGIKKKDIGRFILCALTGIAINQTMFIKGLTMTTTIHAALLMLVTPIIISVFALFVLKEKFTIYKAIGLSLGIGGSIFLILQKEAAHHAENYLLGDMFIIVNAISYSIYFILAKPLMKDYSPLHVVRWVFTLGSVMLLFIGIPQLRSIQWNEFQWQHLAALCSVVVLGTFLSYYFNAYGLQKLGAGITGTYIYTQPFFTVVIATFFLGETLSWQKLVAGLFIFAGVYLVSFQKTKQKLETTTQ
jgi:drug/metabolite transporter (DMT)-like permease